MALWNPNRPMMGSRSFGGFPQGIPEGTWQGGAMLRPPGAPAFRPPPPPGYQMIRGGGSGGDFTGPIAPIRQPLIRAPGGGLGGGQLGNQYPRYPGGGFAAPIRQPGFPTSPMVGIGDYEQRQFAGAYPGGGYYGGYPGGGFFGRPGMIGGVIGNPFLEFVRRQYGQGLGAPFNQPVRLY